MPLIGNTPSDPPLAATGSSWRWANVPLPEPHLAALLSGGVLHLARPWRLPGPRRWYILAGWTLVGAGVAIATAAVRTAAVVDLDRPATLVTAGPYAWSRNPMYLGWTLVYIGLGLAARNAWIVAALPTVVGMTHREIRHEEQAMGAAFGPAYIRYRIRVRRYF